MIGGKLRRLWWLGGLAFFIAVPKAAAKPGYKNTEFVRLLLSATDGGSGMGDGAQMRFSNDGATWYQPEDYATVRDNWDLTAFGGGTSDGTKTVYARFKDSAGNWSVAEITASVVLDRVSPVTTAAPGGGLYNQPQTVSLSCSEEAVIYYTLDGTEPTTASSVYTAPLTISGSMTLKFFAVDNAENTGAVKAETYAIDDTPPTASLSINGAAAATNEPTVQLTISESDDGAVVGWLVSETHTATPAGNDPAWVTVRPDSYNLSAGDGIKTLYLWVKDAAGNISQAAVSASILLDTTPPTGTLEILF